MSKVSIIMPAYNAEEYISTAINSVISQTYKDWELVVCDDCSSDNTVDIVEEYCRQHNNIVLIKRKENSGAARLPRKDAALATTGGLIMTFDADDFLDSEYVEKMYNRKQETKASIVLSHLVFCNERGKLNGKEIPNKSFDYNQIITGRLAAMLMLGEVRISVNGLLCDKELYINNIISQDKATDNCSFADEIDQRKLLMRNKTVAFADAKYYYRQQPGSLMHNTGVKRYDFLTSLEVIYRFAKENFHEKEVFKRLDNEFLTNLLFCQRDYYVYEHFKLKEKNIINEKIIKAYNFAKSEQMKPANIKQRTCMQSYTFFRFISFIYSFYLKYKR